MSSQDWHSFCRSSQDMSVDIFLAIIIISPAFPPSPAFPTSHPTHRIPTYYHKRRWVRLEAAWLGLWVRQETWQLRVWNCSEVPLGTIVFSSSSSASIRHRHSRMLHCWSINHRMRSGMTARLYEYKFKWGPSIDLPSLWGTADTLMQNAKSPIWCTHGNTDSVGQFLHSPYTC